MLLMFMQVHWPLPWLEHFRPLNITSTQGSALACWACADMLDMFLISSHLLHGWSSWSDEQHAAM